MNVLLLSRYSRLGASSRLRSYQFLPYLKSSGIDVLVAPLFGDDYVAGLYFGKISYVKVFNSYISRLKCMMSSNKFNLVWVEKEMLPWIPSWFELRLTPSTVPLVVDYDDALFHRYDQHRWPLVRWLLGNKIDKVMQRADLVLAGNDYLFGHARKAGAKRIELLPTVVDITRYSVPATRHKRSLTIGWIGSPNTAHYLKSIAHILHDLAISHNIQVVVLGANPDQMRGLPVEIKSWTEENEVKEIQQFDIGIMPLPDKPFERGKCGYKLIQYMACGIPVVASPIGENRVIVEHGVNGFWANTDIEWLIALNKLLENSKLRKHMGGAGRKLVEDKYCTQKIAPKLISLMKSITN